MPELTFAIRWPDGTVQSCYSPSLVVHDHLEAGGEYAIDDFVARASVALRSAAERVRAKYGFACTAALGTLEAIDAAAARVRSGARADGRVRVLSITPPLPTPAQSEGKS